MNKKLKKYLPMFLWNFYVCMVIKELRGPSMKFYAAAWTYYLSIVVSFPLWIWGVLFSLIHIISEAIMDAYEKYVLGYPMRPVILLRKRAERLRAKSFRVLKPEEIRKRLELE
ncbi:hypothetical protein KNU84_gp056 [Bacteriophage DSS3_VP1]|uniref:Uncharacterized protein n=1 Tax=Bacteriophage DSS3_VP1 TaxID=2664196 RepID=A0A7S5FQD1_9CAUD|nr:hypothetical protein KNU84_gp056 [Bacteriophage DSS3_VP1]QGH74648.1 hypothetical protein DSS3VP1_00080 [Bacteriophage DSS3_VP1]